MWGLPHFQQVVARSREGGKRRGGSHTGGFTGRYCHCSVSRPHLSARESGKLLSLPSRRGNELGKEVTPEAQGACADPRGTLPCPQWHVHASTPAHTSSDQSQGFAYVHTRLFRVRFADTRTHMLRPIEVHVCTCLETRPVPRSRPSEGVFLYMCTRVPPSLTLNPPRCLPLLGWCFQVGRGPVLPAHGYAGHSLLEKVSEG